MTELPVDQKLIVTNIVAPAQRDTLAIHSMRGARHVSVFGNSELVTGSFDIALGGEQARVRTLADGLLQ